MKQFTRFLRELPFFLAVPFAVLLAALVLAIADLGWLIFGRKRALLSRMPDTRAATVVIPNWNGRDLLAKYIPSVVEALRGNPDNEIIVVDNASDDGSADFLAAEFPQVTVLRLEHNEGFGGGSNAGFRAARNDIVVLLNSDMRVDPGFLQPLLDGFTDNRVFAVSCQIFFSDPAKLREETGLTEAWWDSGSLRVRHRTEPEINDVYPCFYAGGGSSAFDRHKFLEAGGFDNLLKPFYLEDTDLGFLAWKRGWKVMYQPRSIVFHEHRGTIGKKFTQTYINGVLKKNFALFCWKNIHDWKKLGPHFLFSLVDAGVSLIFGDSPGRNNSRGLLKAVGQLPQAVSSRWAAHRLAMVDDTEAFRRPYGGYFLDRFSVLPANPENVSVLFVSPYPISPPTHGGGVFMYQTCRELTKLSQLHLLVLLDFEHQRAPHQELAIQCASAQFLVRGTGRLHAFGSTRPHAVTEFQSSEVAWAIHRLIYLHRIDVLQLEYTPLGQYAGSFRQIASVLFEHDIYFQSIGRQMAKANSGVRKLRSVYEYLRALRYELTMLPTLDRVQVCSQENARYLLSFRPELAGRIDSGLRAGIDTQSYALTLAGREPDTILFLGGFRHLPNVEAIEWFTRHVFPIVLTANPNARLVMIGADPPPVHSMPYLGRSVELRGFVEDVREPLARYAVFICPILSGSGIRVKLLEAFAAGIPVVSTSLGAEGLADSENQVCILADEPGKFAQGVLHLLANREDAESMAKRARAHLEATRDMRTMTRELEQSYRQEIRRKRASASSSSAS